MSNQQQRRRGFFYCRYLVCFLLLSCGVLPTKKNPSLRSLAAPLDQIEAQSEEILEDAMTQTSKSSGEEAVISECENAPMRATVNPLRRLTKNEYQNTMDTLFGLDFAQALVALPNETAVKSYANDVASQSASGARTMAYMTAAEAVAAQIVASAPTLNRIYSCNITQIGCLTSTMNTLGLWLFRRPLTTGEQEPYLGFAQTFSGTDRVRALIGLMLQSPNYLFRDEMGYGNGGSLNDFELSSRLSFMLFGRGPDAEWLEKAEAGQFTNDLSLDAILTDAIASAEFQDNMEQFVHEWLQLDHLKSVTRENGPIPDPIITAMQNDTKAMFRQALLTPSTSAFSALQGTDLFLSPLTAEYVEGTAVLAQAGKVAFDSPMRGGYLSSPTFAAVTSRAMKTSPIERGVYVLDRFLCRFDDLAAALSAANIAVPDLDPTGEQSLADIEKAHSENPSCAGCHKMIDPIGHGLEMYDTMGRLREHYESGGAVSVAGKVQVLNGIDFSGGKSLGAALAESPIVHSCLVEHLFRYQFGRQIDNQEQCLIENMSHDFREDGLSFLALIKTLVKSDATRFGVK
jgi:hypothetical protein